MASELSEFLWRVPEQGYRWVTAALLDEKGHMPPDAKPERVLTDGLPLGASYMLRQYDPLAEYPTLFRKFAATPATESGILEFANRYGCLGEQRFTGQTLTEEPNHLLGIAGEPFELWRLQIGYIARAIQLWDLIRIGDWRGLARYIRWKVGEEKNEVGELVPIKRVTYTSHPDLPPGKGPRPPDFLSAATITATNYNPEWLDRFPEGNTILPAKVYLHRLINDNLAKRTPTRLLHDLENNWISVLKFVPRNLLGCMWLQLAEEIAGRKKPIQCAGCKEWFYINVEGTRSDNGCGESPAGCEGRPHPARLHCRIRRAVIHWFCSLIRLQKHRNRERVAGRRDVGSRQD